VLGHGELDVTATYANYTPQMWSVLVDSQQLSQIIYFLSGVITENDGTDTRIPNAVVEILDGYNAGKSATSNQFGAYNITGVLTKVTLMVRASKAGYLPSTTTYEVGGPVQFPGETNNRPFLDFRLSRAPQ